MSTGARAAPKVKRGEKPATAAIALRAPTRFQSIGGPSALCPVMCRRVWSTRA